MCTLAIISLFVNVEKGIYKKGIRSQPIRIARFHVLALYMRVFDGDFVLFYGRVIERGSLLHWYLKYRGNFVPKIARYRWTS